MYFIYNVLILFDQEIKYLNGHYDEITWDRNLKFTRMIIVKILSWLVIKA